MPPSSTPPSDLVALLHCDLGAILRGRAMPGERFRAAADSPCVGWVPSAFARPPFGPSVKPNPFGSLGDLLLIADPATVSTLPTRPNETQWDIALCDIHQPDGTPWECCPRRLLNKTLDELQSSHGARAFVSFEQEFQLFPTQDNDQPMSLAQLHSVEPFPVLVTHALSSAGLAPEAFVAESGPAQFEIPIAPAYGVTAADQALVAREVVRAAATIAGRRASFAPMTDPEAPPNGVHINLSLVDRDGQNMFADTASPERLSDLGHRFAAGVLAHADALTAITAPSPVSAARLRPGQRSGASVEVAIADREALLRVPPSIGRSGRGARLEFRGADATANPYLALAVLLRAGMAGLAAAHRPRPVSTLPSSLEEALEALGRDQLIRSALPSTLLEVYTAVKRREIEVAEQGDDLRATCGRYARLY